MDLAKKHHQQRLRTLDRATVRSGPGGRWLSGSLDLLHPIAFYSPVRRHVSHLTFSQAEAMPSIIRASVHRPNCSDSQQ